MNNNIDKAIKLFGSGYNCSQSVFAAYSEKLGVDEKMSKSISAGFGAGFGRLQKTCGAVSGAIMAIGVKCHDDNDVAGSKEIVYRKTREFISDFEQINKTAECLKLLDVDINTEAGMNYAKANNIFKVKCEKYVKDACQILENYL